MQAIASHCYSINKKRNLESYPPSCFLLNGHNFEHLQNYEIIKRDKNNIENISRNGTSNPTNIKDQTEKEVKRSIKKRTISLPSKIRTKTIKHKPEKTIAITALNNTSNDFVQKENNKKPKIDPLPLSTAPPSSPSSYSPTSSSSPEELCACEENTPLSSSARNHFKNDYSNNNAQNYQNGEEEEISPPSSPCIGSIDISSSVCGEELSCMKAIVMTSFSSPLSSNKLENESENGVEETADHSSSPSLSVTEPQPVEFDAPFLTAPISPSSSLLSQHNDEQNYSNNQQNSNNYRNHFLSHSYPQINKRYKNHNGSHFSSSNNYQSNYHNQNYHYKQNNHHGDCDEREKKTPEWRRNGELIRDHSAKFHSFPMLPTDKSDLIENYNADDVRIKFNHENSNDLSQEIDRTKFSTSWISDKTHYEKLSSIEIEKLTESLDESFSLPQIDETSHQPYCDFRQNQIKRGYAKPRPYYFKHQSDSYFEYPRTTCKLLEEEINCFHRWVSPSLFEQKQRQEITSVITDVVKSLWPHADVFVYGSVATNLCLPSSDIDFVVVMDETSFDPLSLLANQLISHSVCEQSEIKLIYSASVPIIKLVHSKSKLPIDISFGNGSYLRNLRTMQNLLAKYKMASPIILLLKQLLHQNSLNFTYAGGLGSYTILVLVVHFIMTHNNVNNLGELFLRFLQFYGISFNYQKFGISCYNFGSFYLKEEKNWFTPWAPSLLSVEDPLDDSTDLGKKCFNIAAVKNLFQSIYNTLIEKITSDDPPSSLLESLLNIDTKFQTRK